MNKYSKTLGEQPPVATILVGVAVLIVVIAGALVTIINPDSLSFDQYLDALSKAAIGAGALGIGRGILGAGKASAGDDPDRGLRGRKVG